MVLAIQQHGTPAPPGRIGPQDGGRSSLAHDSATRLPPGALARIVAADPADKRPIVTIAFSPDGQLLATAGSDRSIHLWTAATGREAHRLLGHKGDVNAVDFAPDGKLLASGSNDGTIRLWGVATGKELRHLSGHGDEVASVAFAPDGKLLASGSWDGTIRFWDPGTGKEVRRLTMQGTRVKAIAFHPNGKMLASASWASDPAGAIRLWDVQTGTETRRFSHGGSGVEALAFSPDGWSLASGHGDAVIILWETASGEERCRLTGEAGYVTSLAFSPDGRLLLSGLAGARGDQAAHLWSLARAFECGRLQDRTSRNTRVVAFAPDGKRLAAGGDDGAALVWDVARVRAMRDSEPTAPRPPDLEILWEHLASRNAEDAYRALWRLAAVPEQSVPFLRQRLEPARIDQKRFDRLLADLDDKRFLVRERANDELARLGLLAEPELRRALEGKPTLEVRRRVERLLARCDQVAPKLLGQLRVVELLEHIGTPEAHDILNRLAKRAPGLPLAQEAKGALDRLVRQNRKP